MSGPSAPQAPEERAPDAAADPAGPDAAGRPDLAGVDAALTAEPAAPAPSLTHPAVEAPSPDVVAAPAAPLVPGAPHFSYPPTAPVATAAEGPVVGEPVAWAPPPAARPRAFVGPWALGLAVVALVAALFVGWMIPVGLAAVVAAVVTLRRPVESRAVGVWALVLGALSILYSVGWLLWAIPQLPSS